MTPKPLRPATKKEKAYARLVATDPKLTNREAYQQVYNTTNMSIPTIDVEASRTLTRPQVKLELDKYSSKAEQVLLETMEYSNGYGKQGGHVGAAYTGQAITAAKDILDRVHGKAKQQIDIQSTSVEVKLDLSGIRLGTHYEQIKPKQVEPSN